MKYQIKSFYYRSNVYFIFVFGQIISGIFLIYFFLNDFQNLQDQKFIVTEIILGLCMVIDISLWSILGEQKFTALYFLESVLIFLFMMFLADIIIQGLVVQSRNIEVFFMSVRLFIQILRLVLQVIRINKINRFNQSCSKKIDIKNSSIDLNLDLDSSINSDKNDFDLAWSS